MIKQPYSECEQCTHIEDCPGPRISDNGFAIHPDECPKPRDISLKKKEKSND